MSEEYPRGKKKRTRSTSNTNNNFVRSVTDAVSGFIPSISKWFYGSSSTNINGSATDSSTDDEDVPITAKTAKRICLSPPEEHGQPTLIDSNWVPNTLETTDPSSKVHRSTQTMPIRSMLRHGPNFESTPVRAVNEESFAEYNNSVLKMQHSASTRRSIFQRREPIVKSSRTRTPKTTSSKFNQSAISNDSSPYFKPSLLNSPFYPGRTTYGGVTSSDLTQANITQNKNVLVKKSTCQTKNVAAMSHSTKTIIDLLENYSSPLLDARRLPQQYMNNSNTSPSSSILASSAHKSKYDYKTQELYIPSTATIMQLTQRSPIKDTSSIARQLIASHSSTIGVNPYPNVVYKQKQDEQKVDNLSNLRKYSIKNKLTRNKRSADNFDEVTPAIILPSAVLQIDPNNLPKFTTMLAPSTLPATSMGCTTSTDSMSILPSTPQYAGQSKTLKNSSHAKSVSFKSMFQFSKPDPVGCNELNTSTIPNFCIGFPGREKDNTLFEENSTDNQENVMPDAKKDYLLTNMLKEWRCSDCWVNNKPDTVKCVCCGAKKQDPTAETPNKCTICKIPYAQTNQQTTSNKCNSCKRNEMSLTDTTPLTVKETTTWKCDDCWVNNEMSVDKCACCSSIRSKKTFPLHNKSLTNITETDWMCGDCSIRNNNSVEKCIACGSLKSYPNAKSNKRSSPIPHDDTANNLSPFKKIKDTHITNIVNLQNNDKWKCSSCLVGNDNDQTRCICCGTDRDLLMKTTDNKPKFSFNTNPNQTFRFGIFNQEPEEVDMDNVMEDESRPVIPKSGGSGTTSNILPAIPTFTITTVGDSVECSKATEEQSNNATFVVSKNLSFPNLMAIQESSAPTYTITNNEQPQEVPKIDFSDIDKNNQNKCLELDTLPKSDNSVSTVPSFSFMGAASPTSDAYSKISKDYVAPPMYQSPAITTVPQDLPAQNAFTFSSSKPNVSGNRFESSVPTAAGKPTAFMMPSESAPSTSAANSAISIFPPTETNTYSLFSKKDDVSKPISLFQNNDSVVTTTQTAVTAGPLFSFVCNTQTNSLPAPTEKAKLNFMFGSNTSENPSMFKPPTFGTIPDSNVSSNKFTLTSANTLGSATGLFGKSLSSNDLSNISTLPIVTLSSTNSDAPTNIISAGNGIQTNTVMTSVFGSSGQKENVWAPNTKPNNLFVPNTTVSTAPTLTHFPFGTSLPFNAHSSTTTFGSNTETAANVFELPSQTSGTQPAMFSNPAESQTIPNIFGNQTSASNQAPSLGGNMFASNTIGAAPTFGSHNSSVSSFETSAVNSAPAPAFNFGSPQAPNLMVFGQQQAQQPAGLYTFRGSPANSPQVQFNMGSAPNTAGRRLRKAVRRNPQR